MSSPPKDLVQQLGAITAESFGDDEVARVAAFRAADQLARRLEKPWAAITRSSWETPFIFSMVITAVDLDLFTHVSKNAPNPTPLADLAAATKAHPDLLARLVRALASVDYVAQPDAATVAATPLTHMVATREAAGTLRWGHSVAHPLAQHVPAALAASNYTSTSDPAKAPFASAFNTDAPYFAWLSTQPALLEDFGAFMRGQSRQHDDWTAVLADPAALVAGAPLDAAAPSGPALFVDIGGSTGHDAALMRAHLPAGSETAGRLVVQDRPEVVATGGEAGLVYAAHDFFRAQPVHGARVYFLKHILHDWPDERAVAILRAIAPAMKPGFSRVVVAERVLPDVGALPPPVGMDINMMSLLSARERTERDWKALFTEAGMRIVQMHRSLVHEQAVLEVELVD